MYHLIGLIYMCVITCYSTFAEPVATYSRTRICDQTIVIGTKLFSVLVDFSLPVQFTNLTCIFRIDTTPGSRIAINFLSPAASYADNLIHKCRTRVTITSLGLNVKKCNSFPKTELSGYEYVNVKYEVIGDQTPYDAGTQFKLLLFTYHLPDLRGKCHNNEILCAESKRCLHSSLKCSNVFDFCGNSMKNCQNQTNIRSAKIREASFSGVYIFLSCLIFLLGVTVYMCFCQGVHLYECVCHCCSVLEKSGSEHLRRNFENNDLTSHANRNEEDNAEITSADNVGDNDNDHESHSSSRESVTFGLPPSYSCLVMSDRGDEINNCDIHVDNTVDNAAEPNRDCGQTSTIELPPSYSTVLGHEDEYNVRVLH